MANPFYVAPLGGLDLGRVGAQVAQGFEQRKQNQLAEEQRIAQQELADRGAEIFSSGTALEKAQFMMENPQFRQQMTEAQGFLSDTTRQARMDGIRRILGGEDHRIVAEETANAIREAGGDPSDTLSLMNLSPQEAKDVVFDHLTFMDPKAAQFFADNQKDICRAPAGALQISLTI